jgi:hypothetical protein
MPRMPQATSGGQFRSGLFTAPSVTFAHHAFSCYRHVQNNRGGKCGIAKAVSGLVLRTLIDRFAQTCRAG